MNLMIQISLISHILSLKIVVTREFAPRLTNGIKKISVLPRFNFCTFYFILVRKPIYATKSHFLHGK